MIEGESDIFELQFEEKSERRPYYFQLDVLKAIAIAFVVMDHSLTWEIKGAMGSVFWERLSIPFFLIVMGFNMGISFKYRNTRSLRELYSIEYFKRKTKRYVLPFIILYLMSIILGLVLGHLDTSIYLRLGYLPFWGPGNWFIPLLFGSILVFPLIYWLFDRRPLVTIGLCFLCELILQFILWFLYPAASSIYDWFIINAIRVNILFFLPAVGLGLWFSKNYDLRKRHNWFVYPYLAFSLFLMLDYSTQFLSSGSGVIGQTMSLIQNFIKGDYTLFFYGYAAYFFLVAFAFFPQTASGVVQKFIERVGKSSYHILLFQIFWMSIVYWSISQTAVVNHEIPDFAAILGWPSIWFYIPFYLLNLLVSFAGGLIWYEVESRVLYRSKAIIKDEMLRP
ncbi:MAG: acyltransferase family protein [Candidatus Thorarchaeota archaeon]